MNSFANSLMLSSAIILAATLISVGFDNIKIDVDMICKPQAHCVMEEK